MKKTSAKPKRSSTKSSRPFREPQYALKADILYREVEGQILILTPRAEFLYTLNASAQVLWPLLARGATEQKLVAALVREYDLARVEAQRDVQAFLHDLRAKGILARK
ncbi:MAG TPA: PqqD family protein [Anaerolineae bacterium]|nr:PqqD family protein [Anaerolineae bacterium]